MFWIPACEGMTKKGAGMTKKIEIASVVSLLRNDRKGVNKRRTINGLTMAFMIIIYYLHFRFVV
jgi:hypothetical protein